MRVHPRDLSVISLYNIIAKYHCKKGEENKSETQCHCVIT
jgi:hypothetical protein